jgi:glycosyltransferase involved in cell wall biosynthesis
MQKISVVIVCRNEEDTIGRCIQSLDGLTDDILVLDNGSTDNTKEIILQTKARLVEAPWEGFGKTKRKANLLSKYDWVLSLDADEAIDAVLKERLMAFEPANATEVFLMRFKNFLGEKHLRFGEWGNDSHVRLFNRQLVNWDESPVHEQLQLPAGTVVKKIEGYILHYTMKDIGEYAEKMVNYALLNASKYAGLGKRSSIAKLYLAPVFAFMKYYFFRLGFLDGWHGFVCAKMTGSYTFMKYARLMELNRKNKKSSTG